MLVIVIVPDTYDISNNMYETGEWFKDLIKVSGIVLKKNPESAQCRGHRTYSITAHATKIGRA
jgi:hypothetical protein